jgi:uncharacterized protein YlxW (UPF0749 family)
VKKTGASITMALVCLILGFMISFQFKAMSSPRNSTSTRRLEDLVNQIDELTKQRDDMTKKVKEYQSKVDEIEKGVASENEVTSKMKGELDNLKKLAGMTDVEGKGIIIKLAPSVDVTSNESSKVYGSDLLEIINELNASGAEAISINEERYVGRTQIREAGYIIKINGTSFDPTQPFTIKALGNPDILEGAFKLPGNIIDDLEQNAGIGVEISKQDNIKILKYNKSLDYKYVK